MPKKNNTPAKPALAPEEALFQAVSLCRKAPLILSICAKHQSCHIERTRSQTQATLYMEFAKEKVIFSV